MLFQCEQVAMLPVPAPKPRFPKRLMTRAALQPCGMHSVPRAVDIASPQPFQAEEKIASRPRSASSQGIRKAFRRVAVDAHAGVRPFVGWPRLGEEHHLVTGHEKPIRKPPQIGLGSAGPRIAAPHDADFHVNESTEKNASITVWKTLPVIFTRLRAHVHAALFQHAF
jgi:hypothetical protein